VQRPVVRRRARRRGAASGPLTVAAECSKPLPTSLADLEDPTLTVRVMESPTDPDTLALVHVTVESTAPARDR